MKKTIFLLSLMALGAMLYGQDAAQPDQQQNSELLQNITKNLNPDDGAADKAADETEDGGGAAEAAAEDEDIDEWLQAFSGPLTTVIYDKETDTRYIIYESDDEIIEYYDFAHIRDYNSLTYILMKLLYRIKNDGFRYASRFSVEYGDFSLPTLVYIRKKNDPSIAYGQLVYPKFRVELSATLQKDAKHTLDFSSPKMMQNIVFTFVVQILPEIEETVGSENFNIERFLGVDIPKQQQ